MAYPPKPHQEHDHDAIISLLRARPFAHLFTTRDNHHHATRLPFILDVEDGSCRRLRAHMNAQNPQAEQLDGAHVLVAFSGPDTYVSPNWRLEANRGPTWDYTAASVWGRAVLRPEREFFETLITDLATAAEAQYSGVSDKPNWTLSDVSKDYVDRLFPNLVSFEIEIDHIEGVSKLHRDFPAEDALSVAAHLEKSDHADSHAVASQIKNAVK